MSLYCPRNRTLVSDFGSLDRIFKELESNALWNTNKQNGAFAPRVDVYEEATEYKVKAELPGIPKENIEIEFDDENTLTLHGHVSNEHETPKPTEGEENSDKNGDATKEKRVWHRERYFGEFSRSFSFPASIDKENVSASLEHGILSISIPKSDKSKKNKKISIG